MVAGRFDTNAHGSNGFRLDRFHVSDSQATFVVAGAAHVQCVTVRCSADTAIHRIRGNYCVFIISKNFKETHIIRRIITKDNGHNMIKRLDLPLCDGTSSVRFSVKHCVRPAEMWPTSVEIRVESAPKRKITLLRRYI